MPNSLMEGAREIFFPQREKCCFCDQGLSLYEDMWCANCYSKILSWKEKYLRCHLCGKLVKNVNICRDCSDNRPLFAFSRAVGGYEGLLRDLLHRFKYKGMRSLAVPLGRLMALEALKHKEYLDSQAITFVPLSPIKLKERGFNQAELLALEVGKWLGMPVENLLEKDVDTSPMAKLSRQERLANLKGVFKVNKRLANYRVMLVDDVITTGSTVISCCEALLQAGISEVFVLTLATGIDMEYKYSSTQ